MGWLTNYPGLTPKSVRRNQPHSPATGLGHITSSRSNVRSSRLPHAASNPKFARSAQPTEFAESLDHTLQTNDQTRYFAAPSNAPPPFDVTPSSPTFPVGFPSVLRMDLSTYYCLSIKITSTLKLSLTVPAPASALSTLLPTHTFFCKLGHHVKVQVLDNETSASLFSYFDTEHISYQLVPPE
jgi:hypothetical protein